MDENCALLCYYAASSGDFLTTFRDNLPVPPSNVKKMGPKSCPEMSVRNYHASLHNNPAERSSLISLNLNKNALNFIYKFRGNVGFSECPKLFADLREEELFSSFTYSV
jgi:hypothetical protein